MFFYLIFLVSVLLLGSFLIGPFSGRVWLVIAMLMYLLFSARRSKVYKKNIYINVFIISIVFLFLAQIMNGDMESFGVKWLFANHFVCVIAFVATCFVIRNDTQNRMTIIISTMMVLLIADSIVTIMQYGNNPIGWAINLLLMQGRNEEVMAFQESHQMLESLAGVAKAPGIFDSAVENGLFIGSCGVLPFYFFLRESKLMKVLATMVMVLSLVACFFCQERAAMLVLLASVLFLFFKIFDKRMKWISLAVILFIAVIVVANINLSSIDYGRFEDVGLFSNESRKDIWSSFLSFISDNLLWGGVDRFKSITGGISPHNYFFNAFVFGGFWGGITLIALYIMLVFKCYKLIVSKTSSNTTRVIAVSFMSILVQSLVHNASIISGDVLTFILLGLMVATEGAKETRVIVRHFHRTTQVPTQ